MLVQWIGIWKRMVRFQIPTCSHSFFTPPQAAFLIQAGFVTLGMVAMAILASVTYVLVRHVWCIRALWCIQYDSETSMEDARPPTPGRIRRAQGNIDVSEV